MQEILNEVVKALVVASVGVIAPVVVAILVQLFRKVNIDLSQAQQATLRNTVQDILVEVEEWASHRIKANVPVTSGQKLSKAVDAIVEEKPNLSEAEAEALVRQELPKIGLGAVSFLNNQEAVKAKQ